jgi:uncharacterized protein (DUF1800 family)
MNNRSANFDLSECRTRRIMLCLFVCALFLLEPVSGVNGYAQRRRRSGAPVKAVATLGQAKQVQLVLTRLGFGPRAGDAERVGQMGVPAYIEEQLHPENLDDSDLDKRLGRLPTLRLSTPAIAELYNPPKPVPSPSPSPSPSPIPAASPAVAQVAEKVTPSGPANMPETQVMTTAVAKEGEKPQTKPAPQAGQKPAPAKNPQQVVTELQRAALLRAVYSRRQLNEALVNFWENHFNIYSQKDADRLMLTSFDRDTIRPFAMGRFRDLLGATAHSAAMLFYLDNWQSTVPRTYPAKDGKPARTTGGVNENYARELMELHTLGVDGGYSQKDVQEVARCFTGWTIRKPNEEGLVFFNPATHDNGEKVVLGHRIPAGGGIGDGEKVLDILASHPSTARFIATKLARRFISDDPPAAVVERAAGVFLKTDGSIVDTLRSIITSPEFLSQQSYLSKTRSPFEYVAAALRVVNAETDADSPVLQWINQMGQPVFGRITPDGYPDRSEQWLTTGTLLVRLNFANALVSNRIKGTRVDLNRLFPDEDARDPGNALIRFAHIALAGDLTPATRSAIDRIAGLEVPGQPGQPTHTAGGGTQVSFAKAPGDGKGAAQGPLVQALTLVIGSPDFQKR